MTTRKADSKGRLSGFVPGTSYEIEDADGVVVATVERSRRTRSIPMPVGQGGIDYLKHFGLDPDFVSVDGHNPLGYFHFSPNEDGGRRIVAGMGGREVLRSWTTWPGGFDYDEFIELCRG